MEEYPIQIHASTISPLKRNKHPTFHDNSSLIHNKRVKPNRIILVNTEELRPMTSTEHPVIGCTKLGKGLIAKIRSPLLHADGTLDLKVVDAKEVARWIASGSTPLNMVIITRDNKVYLAHLPDLSDLALLPAALKTLVRKYLLQEGGSKGIGVQHLIPRSIKELVDPPSEISSVIERCCLKMGQHSFVTNSYSNTLKMCTTEWGTQFTLMEMTGTWLSNNPLDGRKTSIRLTVSATSEKGLKSQPTFVIWNCRDMARESFLPNLALLLEMQLPDVIVLLETRVSIHMARLICQQVHTQRVGGRSKVGVLGGLVIISFNKSFNFEIIQQSTDSATWELYA